VKPTELPRRILNAGFVYSQLRDACLSLHDRFADDEFARLYRQIRPYTMAGNARLRGLHRAVNDVVRRGIEGDVVECGTARGGSAALLGLTLAIRDDARAVWAFDTFTGIPPPTAADPDRHVAELYTGAFRGERTEVEALFGRLGLAGRTRLVQGLFQDTVPRAEVSRISVLHLDGDWYESVRVCLDHLYDRVSNGGVIQIDDYGHWEGARKAVDEFLRERRLDVNLRWLDYTGRQFVKP
jgi:hypothetical protein